MARASRDNMALAAHQSARRRRWRLLLLLLLMSTHAADGKKRKMAQKKPLASDARNQEIGSTPMAAPLCATIFHEADNAARQPPRWDASHRSWDMQSAERGVELYLSGLGIADDTLGRCPIELRQRARTRLHSILVQMWQTSQRGPRGEDTSSTGADTAIFFVRNATTAMADGRVYTV